MSMMSWSTSRKEHISLPKSTYHNNCLLSSIVLQWKDTVWSKLHLVDYLLYSSGPEWERMFVNSLLPIKLVKINKYLTTKPYGLLHPLPILDHVWEDISMDFITALPNSNGKTTIWVLVNRLTKLTHFIPLPPKYLAAYLAVIFLITYTKYIAYQKLSSPIEMPFS